MNGYIFASGKEKAKLVVKNVVNIVYHMKIMLKREKKQLEKEKAILEKAKAKAKKLDGLKSDINKKLNELSHWLI